MDKTLVGLLKQAIDSQPPIGKVNDYDFGNAKSFEVITDAIDAAGYKIEAHQRGIMGTFLCLVPKE
jgi:hypothetical protein